MKRALFFLAGTLLPAAILLSQVPAEQIDQFDRELLEQELNIPGLRRNINKTPLTGKPVPKLKSLKADIGDPPDWNWVRSFTGSGGADIRDIEVDGSGNVYALGIFADSMKIRGTTLVSKGLRDVFLLKVGSFGAISWIRQLEALPEENLYATHVALSSGGVVITGVLESESVSGGGKLANRTGEENIFMSRISSEGTVDWIKLYSEPETKKILSDGDGNILRLIDTALYKYDPDGNSLWDAGSDGNFYDFTLSENEIWLCGAILDTGMVVGDSTFHWGSTTGAFFLTRLDADGDFGSVEFMACNLRDNYGYGNLYIEVEGNRDIYLAGEMRYDIYFRDSIIPAWPNRRFLMRVDTSMDVSWMIAKEIGPVTYIYDLEKVSPNQIFIYGRFYDSISFGDTTLYPDVPYGYGYYLADIDSTGDIRNVYVYENSLYVYDLGPGNTIYTTSYEYYDHWLHKETLSGAESWTIQVWNNGGSASFLYTMDIDEDGNMYAQGYYMGRVCLLGSITKGRGILFMKFGNDGTPVWSKSMDNPDGGPSGIRVDDEGNVYAWGSFSEYIKMEGQEFTNDNPETSDIYLVKLDRDGELKFIKQFDGKGLVYGSGGIDLTPQNDVLITGFFTDTIKMGAYTLISAAQSYDMFVAKINPSGNILWARRYGGNSSDYARSIASDNLGNIYFTGYFRDSISFDSIYFDMDKGIYDFMIVKLDPNGNVVWARRGGPDNYYVRGHAITVQGDQIFVEGLARSWNSSLPEITFGDKVFISEFEANSFLANYTTSGELNWVKLFKVNNYNSPLYKIDTDPPGNIYAGGIFLDTLIVESNLMEGPSDSYSYFILKYSPEGDFRWIKTSESNNTGMLYLYSIAAFEEDIILVAGRVSDGSVNLGGDVIQTASSASFAGLLGEDIIGCVIDLTVETEDEDFGVGNGTAELTIAGGTAPYQIAWSTGDTGTASIDSLLAGTYQVTVVDDKGCEQFGLFSINIKNGPVISLDELGNVSCHGEGDGFIDISVTGGTEPYTYSWDNGYDTQDLHNLQAAPYTITVTDAGGLMVAKEFTIEEPKPLDVSYTINEASCGGASDGSIDVFTSGGTKPYDWEWNTGVFTQSLTGEKAGKYTLTVLDANNCELKADIPLSEKNAPIVETVYIEPADCGIANGAAKVRVVDATIGNINYLWSDSEETTDPEITGQRARGYFVTVTIEGEGCTRIHLVNIPEQKPLDNQICLVTVDTAIGSNLVVWEKVEDAIIYHVYRETSAKDVYLLAGSVPGGDLSVFTDTVANPMIRSYRYKIAAVDECGTESFLSHLHKTVHLTISPGLYDYIVNLRWDDYIGETFDRFEVWRYSSLYSWEKLEDLPSNLKSYTDDAVPPGKVWYNVRVPMPNPCEPTGNNKVGTGPYNHSLSNMDNNKLKETRVETHMSDQFYIYPNPSKGQVTVWSEEFRITDGEIRVTDLAGRLVMIRKFEQNLSGRLELDLSAQPAGSYMVQLRIDEQVFFQKLVKQ